MQCNHSPFIIKVIPKTATTENKNDKKEWKMNNQKIIKWKIKIVPPDGSLRSKKNVCT